MEFSEINASPAVAPIPAVSAAAAAFAQRVRRLEAISEDDAVQHCRRIRDSEAQRTQPAGCYLCAPSCGVCTCWLGGALFLSCSRGCTSTPLLCCLGIPATPVFDCCCCATSKRDAFDSKYGWHFNFGRVYPVDVEQDLFACFINKRQGTAFNTVCCYCKPVLGCGDRCRGEDAEWNDDVVQ